MYGLIRNFSCFLTDQIFIESQDQFKIMLAQTVLAVIFKGRCKENVLFLNICKLLYQCIINCFSHSHMLKGFCQKFIKIPVDQIKFIHEIPVKSLPGKDTVFCNLFYRNVVYSCCLHTFFHRLRKTIFCFFPFNIFCCQFHRFSFHR